MKTWKERAGEATSRFKRGVSSTIDLASGAYNTARDWGGNSQLSYWLTDHLSHQSATVASRAMDREYLLTHIGGGWHRLYDGGHTLLGSWSAVSGTLPDSSTFEKMGTWATEYWKDFITPNGMPIIALDHAEKISDYLKHLDCVNVAQSFGGELIGLSIYCNWNDPEKLIGGTAATDCSAAFGANIVAPLVNLIAMGRVCYLLRKSEQEDLRAFIAPALRGLTRSGANILLITLVPGGFLVHLSGGVVISFANGYVWDKGAENKAAIFTAIKRWASGPVPQPPTSSSPAIA